MLSLVEVKCPHCGAEGQIMLPPMGSIILGPCPECNEMVVVFCGRVLPLEKQLMAEATPEDKKRHLLEVLTNFLRERIELLFSEGDLTSLTGDDMGQPEVKSRERKRKAGPAPISAADVNTFVQDCLRQLDDKEAFKRIFG